MVNVLGYGLREPSSNPRQSCLRLRSWVKKDINPSLLLLAMDR